MTEDRIIRKIAVIFVTENFSVPTVAEDLFWGVLTVLLLGVCAFSMFLVVFLALDVKKFDFSALFGLMLFG